MQVYFLGAAAFAALVTFFVHTFVGGIYVVRPLLADKVLNRTSKWLNYYCWHITTILILAMCATYAYTAFNLENSELVVLVTGLAACNAVLSVAVALKGNINPLRFPSTSLFALTAILGGTSLMV